jgi:predicted RNA-binding Zn-ribbon protein involved in translation (DUF1610 family)
MTVKSTNPAYNPSERFCRPSLIKTVFVTCPSCGSSHKLRELPKNVLDTIHESIDGSDAVFFDCPLCGADDQESVVRRDYL